MTRLLMATLVALMAWPQSSGRIAGSVSTTGEPGQRLPRAYVALIGAEATSHRLTMTRDDGTFVFDDVPPGTYVVEAGKLPHLAGSQRVTLAAGQSKTDLAFRLKRAGAISGDVLDELGQPARNKIVAVLRIRYERGGGMTASPWSSAITDRFGRFRVHSLAPGAYVIATSPADPQSGSATTLNESDVDRVLQGIIPPRPTRPATSAPPVFDPRAQTVFVPGVTRVDAATMFVIDDGTEHTNVTANLVAPLPVGPPTASSLAGVVLDPDGQPVEADVRVNYDVGPVRSGTAYRQVRANHGQFNLVGLTPGPARVVATASGRPLLGFLDLTVTSEPVTGLTIHVHPKVEIVGRATHVAGRSQPKIVVKPEGTRDARETVSVEVKDSGEFVLALFPAKYLIEGGSAVTVDGVDMTDRVIDVRPGLSIKNLIVSFSEHVQDISGRVTNSDGTGVNTVTMVAFSANEADWFHQSRRVVIAEPAADGRYQLGGAGVASLPAGDYHLAAVTDLSPDEQYNPGFLRTLVDAAIRIALAPGQRVVQDVRVR